MYLRAGALVVGPPPIVGTGRCRRSSGGWRDRVGRAGVDGRPPARRLDRHRLFIRIAAEHGQVVLTASEILDRQMRVVRDGIAAGTTAGVAASILPAGRDSSRPG